MSKIPKVILRISSDLEYGRGFLRGVAKYSRTHGPWHFYKHIDVMLYRDDPHKARRPLTRLASLQADGLMTRDPIKDKKPIEAGIPTIFAIHTKEQLPYYPYVIMDHLAIGRMAAEYLIRQGFREFAFYGHSDMFWSRQRGDGFTSKLQEEGFQVNLYQPPKGKVLVSWEETQDHLEKWLLSLSKPVGLLACNDVQAQDIIEACKNSDLHVPDDVAIIGVDNDELLCELTEPPLTSVAVNFAKAGYEAAELLDRLMKGEKMAGQRIVIRPSRVVARQSTNILAVEDIEVRKAIRFIQKSAKRPIAVDDVVDATFLSRRVLEKRFRKLLNHSIMDEIKKTRIDQIAMLLTETSMSLQDITTALNFSGLNNMSRFFHREKGASLSEYRKRTLAGWTGASLAQKNGTDDMK